MSDKPEVEPEEALKQAQLTKEEKEARRVQIIMVGVISPILITIAVLMGLGYLPKGF